jgi:hypothetical protein
MYQKAIKCDNKLKWGQLLILFFKYVLYVSVALALGVKESSLVNNLFTIVNIGVVMFVILAGSFKGKPISIVILVTAKA